LSFSGGEVPEWLSGTLYRVGPGVIQSGETYYDHLFDMPSVLHKYSIDPGRNRFTYQNRIVSLTSEDSEEYNNQVPFGTKVRR
jgi:beta,beta-carotene 9',10'-dioxygenase